MIPAGAADQDLTVEEIAAKYKVPLSTVRNWLGYEDFPGGRTVGAVGGLVVYDEQAVDDWLRATFPARWARGQESENPHNLPEGNEWDLLSLVEIGELEAQVLGREEPVPTSTLRGYLSKKTMPTADRIPGDGRTPEVTDRRWFRRTAYEWLNRPRQRQKRTARSSKR